MVYRGHPSGAEGKVAAYVGVMNHNGLDTGIGSDKKSSEALARRGSSLSVFAGSPEAEFQGWD